jgi:hypothetical protein
MKVYNNYLFKIKTLLLILLLFCAFSIKAQNLILNGSFEDNNVTGLDCKVDLSNSDYSFFINFSNSFSIYGSHENNIFFENCTTYTSSIIPDGIAYDEDYSLLVACLDTVINSFHYERYSALSLSLSQSLQIGAYYTLSYYQKIFPYTGVYNNFLAGQVVIGISDSATTFGTTIDTMAYPTTNWAKVELTFQATIPAQYLTIKSALEQGYHGALVDYFVLELDSVPPTAINEQQGKKQLLKVVDILGKESKPNKKGLLFYIYSDGTVEKKLIIE